MRLQLIKATPIATSLQCNRQVRHHLMSQLSLSGVHGKGRGRGRGKRRVGIQPVSRISSDSMFEGG